MRIRRTVTSIQRPERRDSHLDAQSLDKPTVRNAVVAVIADKNGRTLWTQRALNLAHPGFWTPVTEKIERGKSQEHALIREVREEIGLKIAPIAKIWESAASDRKHVLHWWMVSIEGGLLMLDPSEVADARWMTLGAIHFLEPKFAGDLQFFERILPHHDQGNTG